MSHEHAWQCTQYMINSMLRQDTPPGLCGTPNYYGSLYAEDIATGVGAPTLHPARGALPVIST